MKYATVSQVLYGSEPYLNETILHAMERGKKIHSEIEASLKSGGAHCATRTAFNVVNIAFQFGGGSRWDVEERVVSDEYCYRGRIDFATAAFLFDLKVTKAWSRKSVTPANPWAMQIAAYRQAILEKSDIRLDCGLILVHPRTEEAKLVLLPAIDVDHAFDNFVERLNEFYRYERQGEL